MGIVKFLDEIRDPRVSQLGGKGYSLAILLGNGFSVPKGFAILANVFFEFLRANDLMGKIEKLSSHIQEDNFGEVSRLVRELILQGGAQEETALELRHALEVLDARRVSIRSSAVSEDGLEASFAGMHDTFLNIRAEGERVFDYVKKCWASLFNERAVIYRIRKKLPHLEGMATIVQEMIPAEISGVTFTVHPTNKNALLIEASYGLGDLVVSGKAVPDHLVVDRVSLEILEKKVGHKDKISVCEDEGTTIADTDVELIQKLVLPEKDVRSIAKLCLEVENVFNSPQDIEWCILSSKIWLLQSRAIAPSMRLLEQPAEERILLKGIGASAGVARGRVSIVLDPADVHKVGDGDILVTVMTNPLYVVAIQKARAIVTDVGGMICHAAIIARELGIPCVVGTMGATKKLEGDMEVVVDGTRGLVYLPD